MICTPVLYGMVYRKSPRVKTWLDEIRRADRTRFQQSGVLPTPGDWDEDAHLFSHSVGSSRGSLFACMDAAMQQLQLRMGRDFVPTLTWQGPLEACSWLAPGLIKGRYLRYRDGKRIEPELAGQSAGYAFSYLTGKLDGRNIVQVPYPGDLWELRRCLLMLAGRPELRDRLGELGAQSPAWQGIAAHWGALENQYANEVGDLWNPPESAPDTLAQLKAAAGGGLH